MSSLAIIIIIVLSATLIYVWAKCQSLQKEVHSKENKENELKKLALVLQNINAYFLLIDKDFVVCDTNYYSLNRLPVQVGGVTKRVGDLLHCRNAIAAGECGQHEQCKLCCIRASINNLPSASPQGKEIFVRLSVRLFIRKQVLRIWKLR